MSHPFSQDTSTRTIMDSDLLFATADPPKSLGNLDVGSSWRIGSRLRRRTVLRAVGFVSRISRTALRPILWDP